MSKGVSATSILRDILSPSHFENRDAAGRKDKNSLLRVCGTAKNSNRLVKLYRNLFSYRILFCTLFRGAPSLLPSHFPLLSRPSCPGSFNFWRVRGIRGKKSVEESLALSTGSSVLMFSIYHVAPDCVLDDKGSWPAERAHFSLLHLWSSCSGALFILRNHVRAGA